MNYDNLLKTFTDKEALILSQLAYLNLLPAAKNKNTYNNKVNLFDYKNRSLKSIAQELLDADLKLSNSDYKKIVNPDNKEPIDAPYQAIAASVGRGCVTRTQLREIMNTIIEDEKLGSLVLKDYVDNNHTTGFAAYAFSNPNDNNVVFAFRGSDDGGMDQAIDWPDNFSLGSRLFSIQTKEIGEFVLKNKKMSQQAFVTGHSKGSANAMFAAASFDNITGKCFDGPGIGFDLNAEQNTRLRDSKLINYVAENDPVGSSMLHVENRVFFKQKNDFIATLNPTKADQSYQSFPSDEKGLNKYLNFQGHFTQAIALNGENIIKANRTALSKVIEAATLDLVRRKNTPFSGFDYKLKWNVEKGQETYYLYITEKNGSNIDYSIQFALNGDDDIDFINIPPHFQSGPIQAKGGNDLIMGNELSNEILAGSGNDTIYGGAGVDKINGEDGDDCIIGGSGNDILDGGLGNDTYISQLGDGNDVIFDYLGRNTLKMYGLKTQTKSFKRVKDDIIIEFADNRKITLGNAVKVLHSKKVCSNEDINKTYTVKFVQGFKESSTEEITVGDFDFGHIRKTLNLDQVEFKGKKQLSPYILKTAYGSHNTVSYFGEVSGYIDDVRYSTYAIVAKTEEINNIQHFRFYDLQKQLGGILNWDNEKRTVSFILGDVNALINVDSGVVTINGVENVYEDKPYIDADSRIMISKKLAMDLYRLKEIVIRGEKTMIVQEKFVEQFDHGVGLFQEVIENNIYYIDDKSLLGTEFNDELVGTSDDDLIKGFEGNDKLVGGEGNDTLEGGVGNDALAGGVGNDVYILSKGFGKDKIDDSLSNLLTADYGVDAIKFTDISSTEILPLIRKGNDLQIRLINSEDELIIAKYFESSIYRIEKIEFADGVVWSPEIISKISIADKDELDHENPSSGDAKHTHIYKRGFGDKYLWVSSEKSEVDSDIIVFQDIRSYEVNYKLVPRFSNLMIEVNGTNDKLELLGFMDMPRCKIKELYFSDGVAVNSSVIFENHRNYTAHAKDGGNTVLEGIDSRYVSNVLYGASDHHELIAGPGDDILISGAGNDILDGDYGADTFIFERGFGKDRIKRLSSFAIKMEDIIVFNDIQSDEVRYELIPGTSDIKIKVNGTTDEIIIEDFMFRAVNSFKELQFSDGININYQVIFENHKNYTSRGTSGKDVIRGIASPDVSNSLYGEGGDDIIYGGYGSDVLVGGSGDDFLKGGVGADTYMFERGFGQDVIVEDIRPRDRNNSLILFKDIKSDEVSYELTQGTSDLTIKVNKTTDKITLRDFMAELGAQLKEIQFVDGVIVSGYEIFKNHQNFIARGTSGDDNLNGVVTQYVNNIIYGEEGNDIINGGWGYDEIFGGSGDDLINGNSGNDTLSGGEGTDTFVFKRGFGFDRIIDMHSWRNQLKDVIVFEDIKSDEVKFEVIKESFDVKIKVKDGNWWYEIVLENYLLNPHNNIKELRFSDGVVLSGAMLYDNLSTQLSIGTDGDDVVEGKKWINEKYKIYGMRGNDRLSGGTESDILNGGEGNDLLIGAEGDDYLEGGSGNDYLQGDYGLDTYVFERGFGQDRISEMHKKTEEIKDIIVFKDIRSDEVRYELVSGTSNLKIIVNGTSDEITIEGYMSGNEYQVKDLCFSDGVVVSGKDIFENHRNFIIRGTIGNDELKGSISRGVSNEIHGEDGNDTIWGGNGNDKLYGGTGDDILNGNDGNDILEGGTGNDTLSDGIGKNTYVFSKGFGNDRITTHGLEDIVLFTDIASNEVEFSVVSDSPNASAISINVKGSSDSIIIDAYLFAAIGEFQFSNGVSINGKEIADRLRVNRVIGTDADDVIYGKDIILFTDEIHGSKGNDQIFGQNGNDKLYGDEGNDTLYGGDGCDTLVGGEGNDILRGGTYDDTYVFSKGFGQDTLTDFDDFTFIKDTIRFTDIKSDEVKYSVVEGSMDLLISVKNSTDALRVTSFMDSSKKYVYEFEFADNVKISGKTLFEQMLNYKAFGSDGDDEITGVSLVNSKNELRGMGGNDTISGGVGQDYIEGGTGNDILSGGEGQDTYVFAKGFGKDVINNYISKRPVENDVVRFSDSNEMDLEYKLVSDSTDLRILVKGTDDEIVVKNYMSSSDYRIGKFEFADGKSIDGESLYRKMLINEVHGSSDADSIKGINVIGVKNLLYGEGGNDTLEGSTGADEIYGGSGEDLIIASLGTNRIEAGEGNDNISVGLGIDTCIFKRGFGKDVLKIQESQLPTMNESITNLEFLDIKSSEITFNQVEGTKSVKITINNSSDELLLADLLESNYKKLTKISFADGVTYSGTDIFMRFTDNIVNGTDGDDQINGVDQGTRVNVLDGKSGNDNLTSFGGHDKLYGGEGNDSLSAGDGDDLLIGGSGNDYLFGRSGNDTYVFEKGFGQDLIFEDIMDANFGKNTIVFKDILSTEVDYSVEHQSGLLIKVKGTNDSVRLDFFVGRGDKSQIAEIHFADGKVLTGEQLLEIATPNILTGTSGNDVLTVVQNGNKKNIVNGESGNDKIYGSNISDCLNGGDGDDIITGNAGDDVINGGNGFDTMYFGLGDGVDSIGNDFTYNDNEVQYRDQIEKVVLKNSIAIESTRFIRSESDLVIDFMNGKDAIIIRNYYIKGQSELTPPFSINFEKTNTTLTREMIEGRMGSVNNQISTGVLLGTVLDDSFDLSQGYYGDKVRVDAGNGADRIVGGGSDDYQVGGLGSDEYIQSRGHDVISEVFNANDINRVNIDAKYEECAFVLDPFNSENLLIKNRTGEIVIEGFMKANSIEKMLFTFDWSSRTSTTLDGVELRKRVGSLVAMNDGQNQIITCSNVGQPIQGGNGADIFNVIFDGKEHIIADWNTLKNEYDEIFFNCPSKLVDINFATSDSDDILLTHKPTNTKLLLKGGFTDFQKRFLSYDSYAQTCIRFSDHYFKGKDLFNSLTTQRFDYSSQQVNQLIEPEIRDSRVKNVEIVGGKGNDTIKGASGVSNVIFGEAGDDSIICNDNFDTLIGGTGNDYLDGGNGSDAYVFARGFGKDVIKDSGTTENGNQIYFEGISIEELKVAFSEDRRSCIISTSNAGDQVTLLDYMVNSPVKYFDLFFKNNHGVVELNNLIDNAKRIELRGNASKNILNGRNDSFYYDAIYGLGGNDTLNGFAGDDRLYGGAGNDILNGGEGNDIYVFEKGFGTDTISDLSGDSLLNFDFELDKLTFTKSGSDLYVRESGTKNSVCIKDWEKFKLKTGSQFSSNYSGCIAVNRIENLIQEMAAFTKSKGISWDQAIIKNKEEVRGIFSSYSEFRNEQFGNSQF